MNNSGIKAVPVMGEGRLLGIVTLEHLSEVFMLLSSTEKPILPHEIMPLTASRRFMKAH